MVLALILSSTHQHLTALFRRFMSLPPSYVTGLFARTDYQLETLSWHDMLRDEDAGSCKLKHIEFCKMKNDKRHEFLVLYFSHHTHPVTLAVVAVDRIVKDLTQSSFIVLPSIASGKEPTEALDRVHVMGQPGNPETYLSRIFGEHDKLCVLKYSSPESSFTSQPPSAVEISALLLVISKHQPNYNLYEYNCYWYADMVFEACKKLFPGHQEVCIKHLDRGRCRLNLPMLATHTLSDICKDYIVEWDRVMQRRKGNQEIQQEWQQRLEEEQRAHQAAQQELERLAAKIQTHEMMQQDLTRKLGEAERRCEQLQAVTQIPQHLAVLSGEMLDRPCS